MSRGRWGEETCQAAIWGVVVCGEGAGFKDVVGCTLPFRSPRLKAIGLVHRPRLRSGDVRGDELRASDDVPVACNAMVRVT